jgi:drug/metabolite transporter (DMT)-like permease
MRIMNDAATPSLRKVGLRAEAALVLTTFLWGLSFPWMKTWQEASSGCPGGKLLSGLTLIALRMAIACVLLGLVQPLLLWRPTRREHAVGSLLGLVFGTGFVLQVWGLGSDATTPARSAFFTSLASAWAPLFGWLFLRLRVSVWNFIGLGCGLVGTTFFVGDDWLLGPGDTLTLLASLFFAAQVLLLDRLGRQLESAHLTPAFFLTTGLLAAGVAVLVASGGCGLAAWWSWLGGMMHNFAVVRILLLLALLPTLIAFHLMNRYQPHIPASRAALIYLLEPVFSSIVSVSLGQDPITVALLCGGGLILLGNLLVEIAGWLQARRATSK